MARSRKHRWMGWVVALPLVAFIGIALTGYLINNAGIDKKEPSMLMVEPRQIPSTKENKVVDWVYSKSSLISRKECKALVTVVQRYDNALLLLAIAELESQGFIPTSKSAKVGAIGYWQINYSAHKEELNKIGVTDPRDLFDLEVNCKAADMILRQKLALPAVNGDVAKALEAYLGGQDGAYVKRILTNLGNLYMIMNRRDK